MDFKLVRKKITDYEYQRNKLLVLSSCLLIIVLLETICLLFKNERVIILPPEVRKEFWAEGNRFSPEYLEEQAVYMIHLALDVNQVNYPYNMEILMRYADGDTCNYSREEFEKNHKKLKQNDASTRFDVKGTVIYPRKNKVYITGTMNNFVGSKSIRTKQETYVVEFKVYRGRLFLKDLKQAEEADVKEFRVKHLGTYEVGKYMGEKFEVSCDSNVMIPLIEAEFWEEEDVALTFTELEICKGKNAILYVLVRS